MGLQQFERRLERLVEGVFAKAFRSGLQPVELGRRVTREMDLHRTVAPRGTLAPNDFTIALSPADFNIELTPDGRLPPGMLLVSGEMTAGPGPSALVMPDGRRIPLGPDPVT